MAKAVFELPRMDVREITMDKKGFEAYHAAYRAKHGERPQVDTTPTQHLDGVDLIKEESE